MGSLRRARRLVRFAVVGLVVAAVATELTKPEAERSWEGRVFGLVPYDFRPPTWERIRTAYWNPDSDRLFSYWDYRAGDFHQGRGAELAVCLSFAINALRGLVSLWGLS